MARICANTFAMPMATITITMLVMIMVMKVAERNSGWTFSRRGPICTPLRASAEAITAAALPPGIPRHSRGTMAPPVAALFAASEAAMPSMMPVPNFSGYLESLFSMV